MTVNVTPGTSVTRNIDVFSDATQATPLNLTGSSFALKIYDAPGGTLVTDISGAVATLDALTGKLYFVLNIPAGYGYHVLWFEVVLTEADLTKTVIDSGKITIGVL